MLRPDERRLLLDALRPPEEMTLDVAVGTTYTLDLLSLLLTPLGFAMFEADQTVEDDGAPLDELALLEAVRRYADVTTVFCHRGEIALPAKYRMDTIYTEGMVQQVRPKTPGAAFHPKTWLLRFTGDSGVRHRFIVLSRNLTLDRSWDTVLVIDETITTDEDSESSDPTGNTRFGADVADWVQSLTQLPGADLQPQRADQLQDLRSTVRAARFSPPPPFTDMTLLPFGVGGTDSWPFPAPAASPFPAPVRKLAVVSPFITDGTLQKLARATGGDRVLISRPDSLAAVSSDVLAEFSTVLVLDPDARAPEAIDGSVARDASGGDVGSAGLHAKVYVLDHGREASVYVGSANATHAAFHGNVEAVVRLDGPAREVGVAALMEGGPGAPALGDITTSWKADPEQPEPEDEAVDRLDRLMDEITAQSFTLRVADIEQTRETGGERRVRYEVRLDWERMELRGTEIRAWLISRCPESATVLDPSTDTVELEPVSFEGLTPYLALELRDRSPADGPGSGASPASKRAVVRCESQGFPEDRAAKMLARILSDRGKVLRYLLLLLTDADSAGGSGFGLAAGHQPGGAGSDSVGGWAELPLFELLVRALAVNPAVLDRTNRVVTELRESGAADRLPEDWDRIWCPVWEARRALAAADGSDPR